MSGFWGNAPWIGETQHKYTKKLTKHENKICSMISKVTANSKYHSMYHPWWNKNPIKEVFWWDVVWCQISHKFDCAVAPTIFRALRSLFPIGNYDCSYTGIRHDNNTDKYPHKNILYLVKRSKKTYIKEDVLTEMSEFINACLCGTDIKYVFYGSLSCDKTYGFNQNEEGRWTARRKTAPLYEKEKTALLKNSNWELVENDIKVHYTYTERIWDKENCKTRDYYAHGWFFKIPNKMSKNDAEKIFTKIREKRLKELHIEL